MSTLNNLAITTTNRLMTTAIGRAFDTLQSLIANGGRDNNCKFYFNNGAGGSILQVVAKSVVGGAVSDIKDVAVNHFNSWLNGKDEPKQQGMTWVKAGVEKKEAEEKLYGKMLVNEGKATVYALDDWGCICPDKWLGEPRAPGTLPPAECCHNRPQAAVHSRRHWLALPSLGQTSTENSECRWRRAHCGWPFPHRVHATGSSLPFPPISPQCRGAVRGECCSASWASCGARFPLHRGLGRPPQCWSAECWNSTSPGCGCWCHS